MELDAIPISDICKDIESGTTRAVKQRTNTTFPESEEDDFSLIHFVSQLQMDCCDTGSELNDDIPRDISEARDITSQLEDMFQ